MTDATLLEGIRVVDFSTYLPGPYASLLFASLGARVVHVEPPAGDPARHLPPVLGGDGMLHRWVGQGKHAMRVDLKSPEASALLEPLLKEADVVVEGFRPGVADRLGIGYAAIREVNPSVVYCSLTSFGQADGAPRTPAHDLNYVARAGLLDLTRDSAGDPVQIGFPMGDVAAGLHAALVITAALLDRARTGHGHYLDVSALGAAMSLAGMQLVKAFNGHDIRKDDLSLGGDPACAIYRTRDSRHLTIACIEDKFWRRLCHLLGLADVVEQRHSRPESVFARLGEVFAGKDLAEWCDLLEGAEVCFAPVNSAAGVRVDPIVQGTGLVTPVVSSDGVEVVTLAHPWRIDP